MGNSLKDESPMSESNQNNGKHWPYPPISGLAVADVVLWARKKLGLWTTNLDLNKNIYLIHGWTLGVYGAPLISDQIEAWRLGPVIPPVYHEYKIFGRDPIDVEVESLDEEASPFVSWIFEGVEAYKGWSTSELIDLCHRKGTPWDTVTKEYREKYGVLVFHIEIPESIIKKYYTDRAKAQGL